LTNLDRPNRCCLPSPALIGPFVAIVGFFAVT
jgi:hypothetical protein